MIRRTFLLSVFVVSLSLTTAAKNLDLSTLPKRNTVQLTIYNSEDITLVRETRYLTFNKGPNTLQFSWANTLIDPTSIELRPLEHTDEIEVRATVFPGQKPQHLIWHVDSEYVGQAKVEVSYFTSGLTWKMDYVSICDPQETTMQFKGFVRVFNTSGETYDGAEVRLIVGHINLVEKIAELAQRYAQAVPQPGTAKWSELRSRAAKMAFDEAEVAMDALAEPPSAIVQPPAAPKGVVKEGISEYFMFSVQGNETVPNGWSKRMRAIKVDDVKFDIVHRLRAYQYGTLPIRFFIWTNDAEHGLGDCPLPDGLVRVFRDNGRDGLAFLAEQNIRYVPIKAKAEINLGVDRLVVFRPRRVRTRRFNFHFNHNNHVDGWDEQQTWVDDIRNYRDKPLVLEMRKLYEGDVEFASEIETWVFDYRTVETKLTVPTGGSLAYPYVVTIHHGANAGEKRVRLKK